MKYRIERFFTINEVLDYLAEKKINFLRTDSKPVDAVELLLLQHYQQPENKKDLSSFVTHIDLKDDRFRFFRDHVVFGEVWLPGAAFVEMAIEGALETLRPQSPARVVLSDVVFAKPVSFVNSDRVELKLDIRSVGRANGYRFKISSRFYPQQPVQEESSWTGNVLGRFRLATAKENIVPIPVTELQNKFRKILSRETIYQRFRSLGFDYGSAFQEIELGWAGNGEALIKLQSRNSYQPWYYLLYPSVLDAVFQSVMIAGDSSLAIPEQLFIPIGLRQLTIQRVFKDGKVTPVKWALCHTVTIAPDQALFDITLLDKQGVILAEIQGFRLVSISATSKSLYGTHRKRLESGQTCKTSASAVSVPDKDNVRPMTVKGVSQ